MSSRKKFIQQSSLLMGGAALASAFDNRAFAYFKNRIMPSDQLNIGAIGINGMWQHNNNADATDFAIPNYQLFDVGFLYITVGNGTISP